MGNKTSTPTYPAFQIGPVGDMGNYPTSHKIPLDNFFPDNAKDFGSLYLGSVDAATNGNFIDSKNITAIVCCLSKTEKDILIGDEIERYPFAKESPKSYLFIEAMDSVSHQFDFSESTEFIYTHLRSGKNVFVHCFAGMSRSSTILTAFLILKSGSSLSSAISHLQKHRSIVRPNPSFTKQLKQLEEDSNTTSKN